MTTTRYIAPGIQRRYRTLYAIQEIPKALRPKFNGRARFIQTLETDSLQVAKRRAAVLIAEWKTEIEEARSDRPIDDADFFQRALSRAQSPKARSRVMGAIELEAENRSYITMDEGDTAADYLERMAEAEREVSQFVKEATGQVVKLALHIDDWVEQSGLATKTAVEAKRELEAFAKRFPTVDSITRQAIQADVYGMSHTVVPNTLRKKLAHFRSFWSFLQRHELAPQGDKPFDGLDIPKAKNGNGKKAKRVPFTAADIKKLVEASEGPMQSLITLAAYTGCRIEELCSLRIADVSEEAISIVSGKTDAAAREIPIHSAIKPLVAKLKADSKEGWLLEGKALQVNKTGQRSHNIGRYFGLFKTKLGYDARYNFHSIRKTVATMFEEAGVQEVVASRILGHAIKTMSYGVYSGGVSLEVKREAMEKAIRY